jgi:hypothetical protein
MGTEEHHRPAGSPHSIPGNFFFNVFVMTGHWWLVTVILATPEAEIWRMEV